MGRVWLGIAFPLMLGIALLRRMALLKLLSVVGEAVMVDKIAPVAALARDSIETSEGILKYQKLKHLNHLQVEDYFICTCMHRDCISQAILLLENNLTIISAIKLEWLRRK